MSSYVLDKNFNPIHLDEQKEKMIVDNLINKLDANNIKQEDLQYLDENFLNESGFKDQKKLTVVKKVQLFNRLKTKSALALAKSNNDPDYEKYVKALKVADVLRDKMILKYNTKAATVVKQKVKTA